MDGEDLNITSNNGTDPGEDDYVMDGFGVYPTWEYEALITFLVLLCAGGILANLTVGAVILRARWYRQTSYQMILSLLASDLVMIITTFLGLVDGLHRLAGGDPIPRAYADSLGAVFQVGWFGTLHNMVIVSLNRFVSVVFFSRYKSMFTTRNTLLMLAAGWILAGIESVLVAFEVYNLAFEAVALVWVYDKYPGSATFLFYDFAMSGATALLVLVCYSAILVKVNRSRQQVRGSQDNKEHKRSRDEWKLTVQFALVFFVFLLLVMTYFTTFGLELSGYVIPRGLLAWISLLTVLHVTINPYIYMVFNTKLRRHVFGCYGIQVRPQEGSTVGASESVRSTHVRTTQATAAL